MKMARKERDCLLTQDHQYASKTYNYLTPPRTPNFEPLSNDDDNELLDKVALPTEQVHLYSSSFFANYDDNDPFYDFAEDFQEICLPLLKKDCMWGTAEQVRPSRTLPESSSDSITTCSSRNITATPLPLDFRSTTSTPIYFETSCGSNHFMPISTISPSEIESGPKGLISPFRASSISQVAQLLSPNETESEDEIDVVGIPERNKAQSDTTSMTSSDQAQQLMKEKPKKRPMQVVNSPSSIVSASSSDSDDAPGCRPRDSDLDDIAMNRPRNQTTTVRVSHNDLERKRRDELKRKFDCLRAAIPEIENNERAPKVVILKKASAYVALLQGQEHALRMEKENVRKVNAVLMQKLLLMSKGE